MLLELLTLLGALALFVFGMEMMSTGIQKFCGDKLRGFEKWMSSSSSLKQILSGAGITGVIQSSSATSILVVSLVSAATLTLTQGICVIMGANIGTTITAWIVAAIGFNLNITACAFILLGIGFIMSLVKKSWIKNLGEAILGLSLVLVGLIYMESSIPALDALPQLANFVAGLSLHGFGSVLLFLLLGIVIAFVLQSSSVSIVLTMILVVTNWIPFEMGAAIVLGSNIGTTITANIAASGANVLAKRTALAHLIFNVVGAIFVLIFFNYFIKICYWTVEICGFSEDLTNAFGIAAVHTIFNVVATILLVWFKKPFASVLTSWIKDAKLEEDDFHLKFIGTGRTLGTPSISIEQAAKETLNFALTVQHDFKYIKLALLEKDPDKFEDYRLRLVKCEQVTDKFEYEIVAFLNRIATDSLSSDEAVEMKIIYRVISELESLGDSCENISRLLMRLRVRNMSFNQEANEKLCSLIQKVEESLEVMLSNLKNYNNGQAVDIEGAYKAEDSINKTRDMFRNEGIDQIEKGSQNFLVLNYFLDMLAELEAMGDFIINVSQSVSHEFEK